MKTFDILVRKRDQTSFKPAIIWPKYPPLKIGPFQIDKKADNSFSEREWEAKPFPTTAEIQLL